MYFYFGGDNLIILGLFIFVSVLALSIGVGVFFVSVKILLAVKYIIGYIKKRGEK